MLEKQEYIYIYIYNRRKPLNFNVQTNWLIEVELF